MDTNNKTTKGADNAQKLRELMNILGLNQSQLANKIGVKQSNISEMLSGKRPIGSNIINKLIIAFGMNFDWFVWDIGDVFNKKEDRMEFIEKETRPRVPLTAAAGSLSGESIGVTLEQCEQMPLIHQIPYYDFTMFIKGDSMSPRFESGDEIACRRIDQSRFIQWGKVHVLDTTQGFIIKRIYDDGDKIRCVSYNKDYADFSIPKEDIHAISLVVGAVSITEM